MSEVLIDILKGNTESELTDKIYDFKNGLSKMNVVQIAKNTSVKNLTKYLPKGKQQRMFQFKSATLHVKAIAFNQLLSHYNCEMKYEPMKNGDKVNGFI